MTKDSFNIKILTMNWDMNMWYQYVTQGLNNEIESHTRKDQRTYQRKFCSILSRRDRLKEKYPEHLV